MQHAHQFIAASKRLAAVSLSLVMLFGASMPVLAYAEGTDGAGQQSCDQPPPDGTHQPNGADAVTYTYNSCSGLWVSAHYTWDPNTFIKTPLPPMATFVCNPSTGQWDGQVWIYSTSRQIWYQADASYASPPAGYPSQDCPPAAPPAGQQTTDGEGGGSGTGTSSSTTNTTTGNSSTTAGITNNLNSSANSGNALVLGNTIGGNALSGNAQAIANVMNMLQSSGAIATTFVANIDGDVQGNLIVDPNALQPANNDQTQLNAANKLVVNSQNDAAITNNIDLNAASGNASVSENTQAGNATSGSAKAIANVVNMLNSMISARQSFLGVININGNLNGNILVPQNFLDTLLATNAPHTNTSVNSQTLNALNANITNNQSITNNVSSSAVSGAAAVTKNTQAGSAATGAANTNVTIFDLTGDHIMASNTLLVFVNVLGKWVGVIMDAPAGSTAAALGGGVNAASSYAKNTTDGDVTNNQTITNNITVGAKSGDATVDKNTVAGNARSGDAATAVNLLNITSSDFSINNWFGILFINVFGNWYGNFGVAPPASTDVPGSGTSAGSPPRPKVFAFIPHPGHYAANNSSAGGGNDSSVDISLANTVQHVLGSSAASSAAARAAIHHQQNQALFIGAGLFVVGLILLGSERVSDFRKSRTTV